MKSAKKNQLWKTVSTPIIVLYRSCTRLFWQMIAHFVTILIILWSYSNGAKNTNMMGKEEKDIVTVVYRRFLESESDDAWTDLDEKLVVLDWLNDQELVSEAIVKYLSHSKEGTVFRCMQDHKQADCFSPFVLEAVESILVLWNDTKDLHSKNRYVLEFYLAMSDLGLIYSE